MPKYSRDLLVRPLLFEALSGEFNPPTDELSRSHTLGRLSVATFTKGKEYRGRQMSTFQYEPSWASTVLVQLSCAMPEHVRAPYRLESLGLESQGQILSILNGSTLTDGEDILTLVRGTPAKAHEKITRLPLSLGQELSEAQNVVAEAAQEFFNQAAKL